MQKTKSVKLVSAFIELKNKIGKGVRFRVTRDIALSTVSKIMGCGDAMKLSRKEQDEWLLLLLQDIARNTLNMSVNNPIADVYAKIKKLYGFDIHDPSTGITLLSFDAVDSLKNVCIHDPFTPGRNEIFQDGE